MDDNTSTGTPKEFTSLRVMYDPKSKSPCLMMDGQVYILDPVTAEGIAQGLVVSVALANRARSAELN